VAAVFSGLLAVLAFREQRLRLRPYVCIERIDTHITDETITWRLGIKNVGLLPAKKVVISPTLSTQTMSKGLTEDKQRSKAIIVPQQIFWNSVRVKGETKRGIMQGALNPIMDVSIIIPLKRATNKFYNPLILINPVFTILLTNMVL